MKLKGHSIGLRIEDEVERSQHWRGNAGSHGPEGGGYRGAEEMNHGTLLYSKWELGFEDSESQWAIGKLFGLV